MIPRNQPPAITELQKILFNSYANVKRCAQAYWRSYNGKFWEISEKAEKQLRVDISNLVNAMTNTYHLSEEDSNSLLEGLHRLRFGLTHTSTRHWDTTLQDIELVCQRPNYASLVANALYDFKDESIFDEEKLALLQTADKTFFANYKNYHQIHFVGYGELGFIGVPRALKKYLFKRVIQSSDNEEEYKIAKVSRYQAEFDEISEQANNKIFRIKKSDLIEVMTIFKGLSNSDKEDVLKKSQNIDGDESEEKSYAYLTPEQIDNFVNVMHEKIDANRSMHLFEDIINLYDGVELEAETSLLQPEQLNFVLRTLYAACMPYVKSFCFLGGRPEGWKFPEPTPEEVIQTERDNVNKVVAKQLLNKMIGEERTLAFLPLWKMEKFEPVFETSLLMRFFVIDKKHAAGFSASIMLLWKVEYKFWKPLLADLDYLCLFLKNNICSTTINNDKKLLGANFDDDRHICKNFRTRDGMCFRYPVLILAAGIHWLGHHAIDTPDNKDRLFEFKKYSAPLSCINSSYYSHSEEISAERKSFYQKLFTMVLDGMQLLKNRSLGLTTKTNPAVHNILKKKGLFRTNDDRKESYRNAIQMGRKEYQTYVNRKY